MNTKSSFGIAKRLYAVAFLLSLGLVGVAVYAYFNLSTVATLAERTRAKRVPQLQRMATLELNVTRVSLQLRHAMLARTPAEMQTALNDIGAKRKLIEALLADYAKQVATPVERGLFERTEPLVAKFWQFGVANIQLIESGQKAEAFAFLVDKTIPVRNELLTLLAETVAFQQERLDEEIRTVESQTQGTLVVLMTLVVSSIAALVAFSWYVANLLRMRVDLARTVAERVRDGNLAAPIEDNARDEFSPLLAALGEMQASLARVVADVRANAESVSTASTEIAHGNQDLSERTEKQASALQQTSATMEELGVTVTNNADNARHASQLAQGASTVAAKGGDVVGQVVETMRGINDSSKQIADIIGVIDGIAFQTNILSLNAAVEAARAGEQGRGFAVVASEVRNLAQRSAEAARQIKDLIMDSVARVEHGTALVGRAGETMTEIVEAIKSVSHIVTEISSASAQQSAGVSEVCQTVTQLDEATQQNAALVEQSAAAAESLKSQAMELVRAVAVFKLAASDRKVAATVKGNPRRLPAPTGSKAPTPPTTGAGAGAGPFPLAAAGADAQWATF